MNSNTFKVYQFLLLNGLFCIALLLLRVYVTGSLFYGFLVWNLFLATLPFLISSSLSKTVWLKKQTFPLLLILGIWLLFLPNAPYLITDLMHLRHSLSSLPWLDPFMLFAFAWNGLVLGLLSMHQVYLILTEKWNRTIAKRILFITVFLCGFGIYLGRFQRWNSWELFSDPIILLKDCVDSISNPMYRTRTLGITLSFGFFLWILFLTVENFLPTKKASRN
ncbi:DUF1361 domain-containing protein [Kordia sp. YSTF-M3]|uniref:DUF1361 domain-containing protein n=1 Tax=Kordia aestuariivivens TaxID=2759037 RepID=A0ABR7QBP4_9FLAO|nr:DUF1361 domain-containing protein [Kordia aestuariivivens]MBC8755999.1 DUF1361 domain-containing protein [Kordia aestuariivivens]